MNPNKGKKLDNAELPDNPGRSGRPGMSEQTYLNASRTLVMSTNGTTTVNVQTSEDWNEDTYRYVYIAQARGQNNPSTTTETLEFGNSAIKHGTSEN